MIVLFITISKLAFLGRKYSHCIVLSLYLFIVCSVRRKCMFVCIVCFTFTETTISKATPFRAHSFIGVFVYYLLSLSQIRNRENRIETVNGIVRFAQVAKVDSC